ncbi:HAMP domain-containing protein [Marinobacterium aestuariivivens]|uniref:HAMP domain-containing protein n=1 Tax=Marinobacterium aestuariivivens TaxID=1698799 RepID=A0ABW1ZUW7_9GAMM
MTDSDMLRVEVLDEGLHPVADRHSPLWEEIADTRVIEQPILYRNAHIEQQAGLLRVTVGQTRLYNSIRQQIEEISILLFSLVLAVLICTWIIQTRVIGRPLNRLLETIITSRERPFQRLHWPIPDEFGRISAAFNRMQDNLEQQHRALAESELRFRSLYNRTPALLLILSRDGTIIDTSDHLLEFLGFNRNDLIGTPWHN